MPPVQNHARINPSVMLNQFTHLLNDSKIHSKPLNALAKSLTTVSNSAVLYHNLGLKNPQELQQIMDPLFSKLNDQHSNIHEKKEVKLTSIKDALMTRSLCVFNKKIDEQKSKINHELENLHIHQDRMEDSLLQKKEIVTLAKKNVCSLYEERQNLAENDFLAEDQKRSESHEREIATVAGKYDTEISQAMQSRDALTQQLKSIKEQLPVLVRNNSGLNINELLDYAARGFIYNDRDTGFGATSWRQHLTSDSYAKKHFGYAVEYGRREYVENKVPSAEGEKWQKLVDEYCDTRKLFAQSQKTISTLESEKEQQLGRLKDNPPLPYKLELEGNIKKEQKTLIDNIELIHQLRGENSQLDKKISQKEMHIRALDSERVEMERASKMERAGNMAHSTRL